MSEWNDAEKRVERAHELYERGQWQAALDELKAAIEINPYNGSWHFNLGLTYDAMERTEDAIASYRQALEMEPEDMEGLCAVGIDSNRTGNFDDAIKFLERIEALGKPFDPEEHEAVMHVEGEGGEPGVRDVVRAGYRLKGRVLRPAMVKVAT